MWRIWEEQAYVSKEFFFLDGKIIIKRKRNEKVIATDVFFQ
jgi:hypothetical protein